MFNSIEFDSKEAFDAMKFTDEQLSLLRWVTYSVDCNQTYVVKSTYITPGLYMSWELE